MLQIRSIRDSEFAPWNVAEVDGVFAGLSEDTVYLFEVGRADARAYVDDMALQREGPSTFRWCPNFYAGRVIAEIVSPDAVTQRYVLDVGPSPAKSGQEAFDEMVAEIRVFDQALLIGLSPATMAFGRDGRVGRYELDVSLSRVREHGPSFLNAIERIVRSPHRQLTADMQLLPLSRVRQLHPTSLLDRRLAALATGNSLQAELLDSFQVQGLTSAPTFDTPANRCLLALLKRFKATLISLEEAVKNLRLGSPHEEQLVRCERRLHDLGVLAKRTHKFLLGPLFREVIKAETSASGLTQISAQPTYSRAYRLGCRALSMQIDGEEATDQLHVLPSWGIYETWCFLTVADCAAQVTGRAGAERPSKAVHAERAIHFELAGGDRLEILFQATFPSLKASTGRVGWSISGERRPDIVLVHHRSADVRTMLFDAKWRSGRSNVLDAMESAHVYHDALRVNDARPSHCALLLPGLPSVPELETEGFMETHGVGSVSSVRVGASGNLRVQEIIRSWLEA